MVRKLKVFQTSLGFFDLAIAAPSMKAALAAWGANSNLFHDGVAKESSDGDVIAAALSKPGVVLRRPVGTSKPFSEHADLPTHLDGGRPAGKFRQRQTSTGRPQGPAADDKTDRERQRAFEREQQKREREQQRAAAVEARKQVRRDQAINKARLALTRAEDDHRRRSASLQKERAVLDARAEAEEARWSGQQEKLQKALRRARDI